MGDARLTQMGLEVRDTGGGTEAVLDLNTALINPLTRNLIGKITFSALGERLVVIDPPELVGIAPVGTAGVQRAAEIEEQIHAAFQELIAHIQRRSSELQMLGLQAKVDPQQLSLSAELHTPDGYHFAIGTDKRGNFRVTQARKDERELPLTAGHAFELSEFRDRNALAQYLVALFEHETGTQPAVRPPALKPSSELRFEEVCERFGKGAVVPPRSALDVLVTLAAGGQAYRFAAARVAGRTFRGLLAGAQGKLWAERFELDDFPGVVPLVAKLLGVPQDAVRMLDDGES